MLKAVVSGSFHRHMREIYEAVGELRATGVDVLSPSDPRVVDYVGDFLFVASDRLRVIQTVQDRHFEAIRHCDLLWIASPDGYTGESTSGEIGAAIVLGKPIYVPQPVLNTTWNEYVTVASISEATRMVAAGRRKRTTMAPNLRLDPTAASEAIANAAERSAAILSGRRGLAASDVETQLAACADVIMGAAGSLSR